MTKHIIDTPDAPKSPFFSQAIKIGTVVYTSGITGFDVATAHLAGNTIQEQTYQAIINCQHILRAAGVGLDSVFDVQVLLAEPADFAGLNEVYGKFFAIDPPTRSVAKLGVEMGGILVSIKMTASL